MALLELTFTSKDRLEKDGRSFDCSTCDPKIKKMRRCEEDKEDFTSADGAIFPITITKGGNSYPFCPGKATWEIIYTEILNLLIITYETGSLLTSGGIDNQPSWYIELLGEFLLRYDMFKFSQKAEMILGNSETLKKQTPLKRGGR